MLNQRPAHSTVVAYLALFVAIGGTAMALPGNNTVNSGDVKDEKLKTQDLKNGAAVQGSDVIDESLGVNDLGPDSVQSNEVDDDSLGSPDLAQNSVFNSEIGDNAVGLSEMADNAVGNGEMADNAIKSAEIAGSAVGAADLATITQAADPTPFDFGDQDEGNNDYLYGSSLATCPAGTLVVGGGGRWNTVGFGGAGGDELQAITESTRSGNGWIVWGLTDVDSDDLEAVAYCLAAGT